MLISNSFLSLIKSSLHVYLSSIGCGACLSIVLSNNVEFATKWDIGCLGYPRGIIETGGEFRGGVVMQPHLLCDDGIEPIEAHRVVIEDTRKTAVFVLAIGQTLDQRLELRNGGE